MEIGLGIVELTRKHMQYRAYGYSLSLSLIALSRSNRTQEEYFGTKSKHLSENLSKECTVKSWNQKSNQVTYHACGT